MTRVKTALLLSYICMASVSAAIITPALPAIKHSFHLSHGALEWVISIFLLGYVIGQLIYGPWANRYGRMHAMRGGLLINLIGIMFCLIAVKYGSYALLLMGRLITALGIAAGLSCTFILINELLEDNQAKTAMSFAIVSFTLGIGIAVTLGGIITEYGQWSWCFWALLVHGILMLTLSYQFPETLKEPTTLNLRNLISGYATALKSSHIIVFSLAVGLVSTVAYGYSAAAPIYADRILHMSPATYGYWNLLNMVGMLASGFLSAYLMKAHGPGKTLTTGLILMLPCLVSLGVLSETGEPNALWFFATTMGLYCFSGVIFPAASFFASNAIADKASASSMMSFINMASAMLAVVVMGYLPFAAIFAFILVLSVTYLIMTILLLTTCCLRRGEQTSQNYLSNKPSVPAAVYLMIKL